MNRALFKHYYSYQKTKRISKKEGLDERLWLLSSQGEVKLKKNGELVTQAFVPTQEHYCSGVKNG